MAIDQALLTIEIGMKLTSIRLLDWSDINIEVQEAMDVHSMFPFIFDEPLSLLIYPL
jgi:hypothetical protein